MTKEQVHASYLDEMKALHAGKVPPANRVALVIGSNANRNEPRNIGYHIARRLEADGFNVLDPPMSELNAGVDSHWTRFFESFSGTDTLVLANGWTHMDWIENYPSDQFWRVIDNTLIASMKGTSHFVRNTIDDPWQKHIVYIGSMAHGAVLNASAPYCAAKAGLHAFCKCMGWELTPKGYNVGIVHPSNTEGTPMTERTIKLLMRYRHLTRAQAEGYWGSINLKEGWLQPEDIAETVSYMVSGKNQYMSGRALELSGGQR